MLNTEFEEIHSQVLALSRNPQFGGKNSGD